MSPLRPALSWVQASFVQVHCPQVIDGVRCSGVLIRRIKWPPHWYAYPTPLANEAAATGRGPVKQCAACSRFAEIVIHPTPRGA